MATAADYALDPSKLGITVDASAFRRGGHVTAEARYVITFGDLPFLGWASVPVQAEDVQPVDAYRSFGGLP